MKRKIKYTITGTIAVDPDSYNVPTGDEEDDVILETERDNFQDAPGEWLTAADDANESPTIELEFTA